MAQKALESMTLGHIRSHGCRDLLVYCAAVNCNHSSVIVRITCRTTCLLAHSVSAWCAPVGIGEPMCAAIGGRIRINGTLEK